MDKTTYVENWENQLRNSEYYKKIDHYPTQQIVDEINSEVNDMLDKNLVTKKECSLLTEHLDQPRMSCVLRPCENS